MVKCLKDYIVIKSIKLKNYFYLGFGIRKDIISICSLNSILKLN